MEPTPDLTGLVSQTTDLVTEADNIVVWHHDTCQDIDAAHSAGQSVTASQEDCDLAAAFESGDKYEPGNGDWETYRNTHRTIDRDDTAGW
jgi:predicted nucleotidyltransferase